MMHRRMHRRGLLTTMLGATAALAVTRTALAQVTPAGAIPTGTYGRADDFGATCAFLCSQQARFIVGQNVLLDGGALNVTI